MEAVKQGAATVALKSKTHVVLCALKVNFHCSTCSNSICHRLSACTFGIVRSSKENHVH